MNCITMEQLIALAQDRLPATEAEPIRAHLGAGCEVCTKRIADLHAMLEATAGRHLSTPPEWLLQQVRNLFVWNKTTPRQNRLPRVPAILLVDSFAQGPLPGFRSTESMCRQMLYRAGQYNINLSLNYLERTRAIDMMGQPLPLSPDLGLLAGAEVELVKEARLAQATRSNEFGAFILAGIPEGVYDLRIKKDEEWDIVGLEAVVHPH